jgi:hypothetical protein
VLKIKDRNKGDIYPQNSAVFNVNKLSNDKNEVFGMGLVLRSNSKPVPLVAERLLNCAEIKSQD